MSDFTCTLVCTKWYCPHDCDDPSHGKRGMALIYYRGHYYRPGQLITDN